MIYRLISISDTSYHECFWIIKIEYRFKVQGVMIHVDYMTFVSELIKHWLELTVILTLVLYDLIKYVEFLGVK